MTFFDMFCEPEAQNLDLTVGEADKFNGSMTQYNNRSGEFLIMKIDTFKLERYFAAHEFSTPYLLSCSDCEPLRMQELLEMADDDSKERWENLWLGYTSTQGHPILREEIANLYESITPEDILVTVPGEGIFLAMNSLLEPGDHVITTYPGYQSLYEDARSQQCKVSQWYPRNNSHFDIEDLICQVTPDTKLIVINFPHNPTGMTISRGELDNIIEIATKHDIYIFSDEMYRLLEYSADTRLPSVSDCYSKGISLSGMSKAFSLPGLRIGWLSTQDKKLFQTLCQLKDYTTICSSAPSEILALIALRNRENILRKNLGIIRNNLDVLDRFFETYRRFFCWQRPQAGPIAFPEVITEQDIGEFCLDVCEKKGIMLIPSTVYDYPGKHVRIGYGRKNIPEILEILDDYLRHWQG